eukprot:scaffold122991_cov37-Tisochrysis_lutea.AAC.1
MTLLALLATVKGVLTVRASRGKAASRKRKAACTCTLSPLFEHTEAVGRSLAYDSTLAYPPCCYHVPSPALVPTHQSTRPAARTGARYDQTQANPAPASMRELRLALCPSE